jgi:hypothetical protein
MNPAAFQPHRHEPRSDSHREDDNLEKLVPVSHSFMEPGNEGIIFAVICLLCSGIIYCGVLLIRFLS